MTLLPRTSQRRAVVVRHNEQQRGQWLSASTVSGHVLTGWGERGMPGHTAADSFVELPVLRLVSSEPGEGVRRAGRA